MTYHEYLAAKDLARADTTPSRPRDNATYRSVQRQLWEVAA